MTTSDQYLLAADLVSKVVERFEREGKSDHGAVDEEGRLCLIMALFQEGQEMFGAAYHPIYEVAREAIREVTGVNYLASFSDFAPLQVVLDALQAAIKDLLRKADADV